MSLVIVTSHWNEDLEWLKKSKYPVVLIDKEGARPSWLTPQHIIPNIGKEVSVYLKYIIENYDNLPEHVAFIHGHETSYHQCHDRPLLEVIEQARINEYDFIPLNNWGKTYAFADEPIDEYMKVVTMWSKFEIPYNTPPLFFILGFPVAAQFIVARHRILRNPKSLYQKWYDKVMANDSKYSETFFEIIWHIIFGEFWFFDMNPYWFNFKVEKTRYWDHMGNVFWKTNEYEN
jgi:hypothetical protein